MLAPITLIAQANAPGQQGRDTTPPPINAASDPLLRGFRWRSIGPVGQGGRVDDIAVVERTPSTFYVGFATGGIWKTTNNGTTFTPIFDTYSTHSIGDIAIAPSNPDVIYVGTGEPNNRQSSSFGDGVYKSTDGGRTFTQVGLRETQSIARVVVHPTNPDIVWVAAVGRLFGANPERGVYRSENGGRSWTRTLTVDANTGATDLVQHPTNPDILFAATYSRRRTAFGFASGGPGTGIWKSTDGGRRWSRVTGNGLPSGTMGRIALDIARSNPNVMYAQIEVAPDKEPVMVAQQGQGGPGAGGGGGFGGGQNLPPDSAVSGVWRSADGGQSWQFMSNQNVRPMYFSQIRVDPNNENTVYVGGVSAYKSVDGGKTWRVLDNLGHVDHHAIWVDPNNSDHVMYGNDGSIDVSWDGAQTWHSLRTWAVGQPYHASVDMRRPYYVCTGLQDNGSWCGPSSVRTGRSLAHDWYRVGGGDGFYSQVDPFDHTLLFVESQGGNMSRVDLRSGTSTNIRPRGTTRGGPGGGGGGGFGGGAQLPSNVVPAPDTSVRFRFNWNTPIVLSPHDPATVYTGANHFFKSRDRGTTWSMSADLTKQIDRDTREVMGHKLSLPTCSRRRVGQCVLSRNDGVSQYGTITTIAESRVQPGVVWVGTDDGNIQVSRDGGVTFTEVSRNLPGGTKEYYVSRVEASHFDAATAYVSLDGHRSDDLKPYVYVTRDLGTTWTSLAASLPLTGNVNTVKQDLRNRNLLYAGTEFGFYVSLDEGKSWKPFMTNLPVVRIDDVILHPRDNDLVLSTHGRSIWILDDVTSLQQLTPAVMAQDAALLEPRNAVAWKQDIRLRRSVTGDHNFEGENAPRGTAIAYHLKNAPSGDVTITIRSVGSDEVFRTITGTKHAGLNQVRWDLCSDAREVRQGEGGGGGGFGGSNPCMQGGGGGGGGGQGQPRRVARLAEPGAYAVTLTVNGRQYTTSVTVLEDVWLQ